MKTLFLLSALTLATLPLHASNAPAAVDSDSFIAAAANAHGEFGKRAATFLLTHMPENDRAKLNNDFLLENLNLAFSARTEFPWAAAVPEERFLNDVLPYAILDETRNPWRAEFLNISRTIVANSNSASEAAQALNREIFDLLEVKYSTERNRANQSATESIDSGKASCTGLSIILINACRSVGIPARITGVAQWVGKPGNHSWVEIWDGEWLFTGAAEYNAEGLNKVWFEADASKAIPNQWQHAVWSSSWQPADSHFPLVWNIRDKSIHAENVTSRYTTPNNPDKNNSATLHLRVLDPTINHNDKRIAATATIQDENGNPIASDTTRAETADYNDTATFHLPKGSYSLILEYKNQSINIPLSIKDTKTHNIQYAWQAGNQSLQWVTLNEQEYVAAESPGLSREAATKALNELWQSLVDSESATRNKELKDKILIHDDLKMRFEARVLGDKPAKGHSLWISMHGGGGAPPAVNDSQWQNQINLYTPEEGIYIAPRAPTNTWNLWHEPHIDILFDRLIANLVLSGQVDPNRIYLLGYSAGGDGAYQLAPRMADRFAAAAMMAGHPNDAEPLGLRNLPFAIYMGGKDAAYDRNKVARQWGDKLAELRKADPEGYPHRVQIYDDLGHWMNGKDAEALPWMSQHTRNPWPKSIVWHQSSVTHNRFYWLALPNDIPTQGQTIRASVDGQIIHIQTNDVNQLTLRLSDTLVDLDQPIGVTINGKRHFAGIVPRTRQAIEQSLAERPDPASAATATLDLEW